MEKLTYELREKLEIDFKDSMSPICGYLRKIYYSNDTLLGKCSLTNKRCKENLPMDVDKCVKYIKFKNEKIRNNRRH